jgi:hypothetical protein
MQRISAVWDPSDFVVTDLKGVFTRSLGVADFIYLVLGLFHKVHA